MQEADPRAAAPTSAILGNCVIFICQVRYMRAGIEPIEAVDPSPESVLMTMTNPYAPPRAAVADIADVHAATELADRGTRLAANILDGLIFAGMVYVPMILALSVGGGATESGGTAVIAIAAGILTLIGLIVWLWLTIKYIQKNGQSIGKKIVHINVVRSDVSPASLGRIFWLRNVVNGLLGVIPLYGLIDVLFIFGESRQCVHDKIADTIVVKA